VWVDGTRGRKGGAIAEQGLTVRVGEKQKLLFFDKICVSSTGETVFLYGKNANKCECYAKFALL